MLCHYSHLPNSIVIIKNSVLDEYLTIEKPAEGLYKEKGSKFKAHIFHVTSEDEVRDILTRLKKEFHNARHHCYAYQLGIEERAYRVNDDGEPSGTAGKPIYGQILSNDLTNVLIVVTRYFGGTKLGVSGLINAYRSTARDAIENAIIITKTINEQYSIVFTYPEINTVMRIVKEEDVQVISQEFDLTCKMQLAVRRRNREKFEQRFEMLHNVRLEYKGRI